MKRGALVGLAVLASSCAPEDALVSRCSTSILSLSTECELSAVRLVQPRSSYLDGNTKNFKIRLSATFSVQKGHVDVAIPGCVEGGRAEVTAERPASVSCDVVLSRSTFQFKVEAKPRDGGAEGFAGRLTFKAI